MSIAPSITPSIEKLRDEIMRVRKEVNNEDIVDPCTSYFEEDLEGFFLKNCQQEFQKVSLCTGSESEEDSKIAKQKKQLDEANEKLRRLQQSAQKTTNSGLAKRVVTPKTKVPRQKDELQRGTNKSHEVQDKPSHLALVLEESNRKLDETTSELSETANELVETSAQLSEISAELYEAKVELSRTKANLSETIAQLTFAKTAQRVAEEKLAALEEVMAEAIDNRVAPLREQVRQANERCTELERLLANTCQDCKLSIEKPTDDAPGLKMSGMLSHVNDYILEDRQGIREFYENQLQSQANMFARNSLMLQEKDLELEEMRVCLEGTQAQLREMYERMDVLLVTEELLRQRDSELEETRESLESTQRRLRETRERMDALLDKQYGSPDCDTKKLEEELSHQYQIQIQELEIRARLAEEANTEMAELIVSLEEQLSQARQTVSQLHSMQTTRAEEDCFEDCREIPEQHNIVKYVPNKSKKGDRSSDNLGKKENVLVAAYQDRFSESKVKVLAMIEDNVSLREQVCAVCGHDRMSSQQGDTVDNTSMQSMQRTRSLSTIIGDGMNDNRSLELRLALTVSDELLKQRDLELEEMRERLESAQKNHLDILERVRGLVVSEETHKQQLQLLEDNKGVTEELLKRRDRELIETRDCLENYRKKNFELQEWVDALMETEETLRKRDRELEETKESLESSKNQLRETQTVVDKLLKSEHLLRQREKEHKGNNAHFSHTNGYDQSHMGDANLAALSEQASITKEYLESTQIKLEEARAKLNELAKTEEKLKQREKELDETRESLESTQRQLKETEELLQEVGETLEETRECLERTQKQLIESQNRANAATMQQESSSSSSSKQREQRTYQTRNRQGSIQKEQSNAFCERCVNFEGMLKKRDQELGEIKETLDNTQRRLKETEKANDTIAVTDHVLKQRKKELEDTKACLESTQKKLKEVQERVDTLAFFEDLVETRKKESEALKEEMYDTQRKLSRTQGRINALLAGDEQIKSLQTTSTQTTSWEMTSTQSKSSREKALEAELETMRQVGRELEYTRECLNCTQAQLIETQEQLSRASTVVAPSSSSSSSSSELIEAKKKIEQLTVMIGIQSSLKQLNMSPEQVRVSEQSLKLRTSVSHRDDAVSEPEPESSHGDMGVGVCAGGYNDGTWTLRGMFSKK